jgi:hypothetical protein
LGPDQSAVYALRERHPGRISDADEVKFRERIGKRIPRARSEAEFRIFLQATIVHDLTVALERLNAGEDGMREAAKQLMQLSREARPEAEANRPEQA